MLDTTEIVAEFGKELAKPAELIYACIIGEVSGSVFEGFPDGEPKDAVDAALKYEDRAIKRCPQLIIGLLKMNGYSIVRDKKDDRLEDEETEAVRQIEFAVYERLKAKYGS